MGHKARHHHGHDDETTPRPPTAEPGKGTLTGALPEASGAYAAFNKVADRLVELDLAVATWNSGLDMLNPSLVSMAGDHAISLWRAILATAPATLASPFEAETEQFIETARAKIGKLGLYHAGSAHIRFQPEPAHDPYSYVPHAVERATACIADVDEVIALARDEALDGPGKMKLALLFQKHLTDDLESRWMQCVVENQRLHRQVFGIEGIAGSILRELTEKQETEGYFAGIHQNVDAKTVVSLDNDADEMESIAKGGDAGASDYIKILDAYEPADRTQLLRILKHRGVLDDCVHRGGGDSLIAYINKTPSFQVWEYSYSRVTMKSDWDKVSSTATEMVDDVPGATLSFVAGVYDSMGEIPAVGGIFKDTAKDVRDLRDFTDDAIGVNKDHKAMRDAIGSGAGQIDGAILKTGAAGELGAAGDVKQAYDAGSTLAKLGGEVMEMRKAFLEAKKDWPVVTGVLSEVASGLTDLVIDEAHGGDHAWDHAIEHLSNALDVGLDRLGELGKDKLGGEEGEKKKKRHDQWDANRTAAGDAAANRATSSELRDATSATLAAGQRVQRGGSAAEQAAAKQELQAHAAKVRALAPDETMARISATKQAEDKLDDAEDREREHTADKEKEDDRAGYYKRALADEVKEAIVAFGVGALKGAKDELLKEAKKREGVDLRQILIEACIEGATSSIVEVVKPKVKEQLAKWISKAIDAVAADLIGPDFSGASALVQGPIDDAVDWGLEKLEVEKKMKEAITSLVERAVGGNESLATREGGDSGDGGDGGDGGDDANESDE